MEKYPMNLKNFYWNIMITPKYTELVSLIEAYFDLRTEYLELNRKECFSRAQKVYEKMNETVWDMVTFIEENINLEQYELKHFDTDVIARNALALALTSMYNDDI